MKKKYEPIESKMLFLRIKRCVLFLLISCLQYSCATLFTGLKDKVVINSFPQNATVKINGEYKGVTPLKVSVTRTIFKKKHVEISKEGFKPETYVLKRCFNAVSLVSNIYIGIDALTGAIIFYHPKYYNSYLLPSDSLAPNPYEIERGKYAYIWNKELPLNWHFFRAKYEKEVTDNFLRTGAATYSWFGYAYNIANEQINFYSFAVFDTGRSWTRTRSNRALKHEQGHFDISEIYSRKFKKKIMETDFTNQHTDSVINKIYLHYIKQLEETQYKYDTETSHCVNKLSQQSWDALIQKELEETKMYEKPFYVISLKK